MVLNDIWLTHSSPLHVYLKLRPSASVQHCKSIGSGKENSALQQREYNKELFYWDRVAEARYGIQLSILSVAHD
jgi:hypothetical protein